MNFTQFYVRQLSAQAPELISELPHSYCPSIYEILLQSTKEMEYNVERAVRVLFCFQCNTNIYLKLKWCLLLKRRDHKCSGFVSSVLFQIGLFYQ